MAKEVDEVVKLQVPADRVNLVSPVGSTLGQAGVNIMGLCKELNARTQNQASSIIPVEINVYEDRSFTFITKTPLAPVLLKEAASIEKGSGEPNKTKVTIVTKDQVCEAANGKMRDLSAADGKAAMRIIEGIVRSMGITIE